MLSTVVRAGSDEPTPEQAPEQAPGATVMVNERSKGLANFPCSRCHDKIDLQKPTVPPRAPHDRMTFKHMAGIEMCVQCHVHDVMDSLQLFTEEHVSFDESDRVCGQCHSEKHKDWTLGIHGKVVGSWQRLRVRYTCTDCHPAHQPKYQPTKTLPPPQFPRFGIRKH